MDSHSAMFEIVGSGSSSSDSFVNISHSSASSISTSASTTTTVTNEDKLRTEVNKLREDKKILESRIRGFRTLSNLLVECRRENEQLKTQLRDQTMSLQATEGQTSVGSVGSPFSLVSLQAAAQHRQSSSAVSAPPVSQPTSQDQKSPSLSPLISSLTLDPRSPPPVSQPPGSGPPSSLQETVGPPDNPRKDTSLASLTPVTNADPKPASSKPPSEAPKQESLEPGSNQQLLNLTGTSTTQVSQPPGPESLGASDASAPELLQLDSDKYDEATYEKVGLQMALGPAGIFGSMYAAGGSTSSRPESRPIDFPSLSSEASTSGLPQPPSHGSAINPPSSTRMHQSMSGLPPSRPGGADLASEVDSMAERLHSGPGNSMAAIACQMHQIAERMSKMEQKDRDQKKLIDTLMRENQDLKRLIKVAESTHQEEIVALREHNSRLVQQLQGQRPQGEGTTVKASTSQGDWVHVEKPCQKGGETPGDCDHSLVDRVRTLEQEKAELQRANSNWKRQWDQMEQTHQLKVSELRSKLMMGEQEMAALKLRQAEQTSDFEGRMLEMKRRISDEENLKEEAQHHQRLAERQCSELQDQLTELRTQLSDTARHKQALSAELSVLKANTAGQETQRSGSANATNAVSRSSLEAEIAMLKEQLKVFAEDFEQERLDRTTAQAARDSAKKSAEQMGRQNHALSMQIKNLQKQIKDRDDTITWTLRQNEIQASDFKKKLAAEWEEKQNLQRRVLSLQQLQQQQHPRRNPYLSTEPIMTYHNPLPVHQPPQPPARPTAAAAAPRMRTITPTLAPEHLPGSWTCSTCTYINYPGRTVCEGCGYVNNPRGYPDQFGFSSSDMYGTEHALLMSRGGDQTQGGMMLGNGDLVVDSGQWITTPN